MDNSNVSKLAAAIYGEGASEDYETMIMIGSSALNRIDANRIQEFGATLDEVLNKGYYAVSQNSPMYQQAISGNFPDKASENKWKQAVAISSGLYRGTIERHPAQFFLKSKEEKRSGIDFKQLKKTGVVGKFNTYSY